MAAKGVIYQFGSLNMAGSAVADADDMASYRAMPKLVVKGRNRRNGGGGDPGDLAEAVEGWLGKVSIMSLNRVQDGDQGVVLWAKLINRLIDKRDIQF